MRFRDGLVTARGQILWIVLLALSSAFILRAALPAEQASATSAQP